MTKNEEVAKISAVPPDGQTIYEESRFQLRQCALRLSDGSIESRGLMIHRGAVVIVPVLDDGRIVMIRNYRWQVGAPLLELPAGTLSVNETSMECAQRELLEETGYWTDNLTPLDSFFAAPGVSTEIMHPYLATYLSYRGQRLEPDEQIEVVLMTRPELRGALTDGTIIDGKTLAVLGRLFLSEWVNALA